MHLANPAHGAVLVCLVLALLAAFAGGVLSAMIRAWPTLCLNIAVALLAAAFIVAA